MTHNRALGQAAGVSEAKLDALDGDYANSGLFTDREIAVVRWAEAVASNQARRDASAFAALERHFSNQQIVELTLVVAVRTMVNLVQEALWTDLEGQDVPPNVRHSVPQEPEEWFRWYVGEVLDSDVQRGSVHADDLG